MAKVFEKAIKVGPEAIDELNHVNNMVYLEWFLDIATAHGSSTGWDLPRMLEMGEGWVVRKHEIEYLAQVLEGEELVLRTWIESVDRVSSVRRYELVRKADGRAAARGSTVWVWINYKTGRPCRIPAALGESYGFTVADKA
jgi:acyl-CoA thioester hydrolase